MIVLYTLPFLVPLSRLMMMLSAIGERLEPLDMNWLSRSARSGYFFRDQQVNDPVALGSFSKIPWLKFRAPLKEGASRALPLVSFFVSWRVAGFSP